MQLLLRRLLLVLSLLGAIGLPACAGQVEATDFRGKRIVLAQPARRIVCLMESALSGLYMLGAESQVVGVSTNVYQEPVYGWYSRLDERIRSKRLPTPGNWDFVSLERVLALRPDLVILWSSQSESIAALEEWGLPVFGVFLSSKEDVYREIQALGALTGKEPRANELVAYTKAEVERFSQRTATLKPQEQPRVYYMWAQGKLETSGAGSTVDDLIRLAGGVNVCGETRREHLVVSLEKVLGWNPDLILMWHNPRLSPGDLRQDPQWRSIKAIQKGRVHQLPEVFLCDLWTLKFQYAAKLVAKWTHPERFKDVDLAQEERTMLSRLYGREVRR